MNILNITQQMSNIDFGKKAQSKKVTRSMVASRQKARVDEIKKAQIREILDQYHEALLLIEKARKKDFKNFSIYDCPVICKKTPYGTTIIREADSNHVPTREVEFIIDTNKVLSVKRFDEEGKETFSYQESDTLNSMKNRAYCNNIRYFVGR